MSDPQPRTDADALVTGVGDSGIESAAQVGLRLERWWPQQVSLLLGLQDKLVVLLLCVIRGLTLVLRRTPVS